MSTCVRECTVAGSMRCDLVCRSDAQEHQLNCCWSHANLRDLPHLWVVVRWTFWSSRFPRRCASFCIGEYKISAGAPLGICAMTTIFLGFFCCCLYCSSCAQSKNVYKAFTGRSLSTPAFNYRSRRTLRRAPWWSHAPLA